MYIQNLSYPLKHIKPSWSPYTLNNAIFLKLTSMHVETKSLHYNLPANLFILSYLFIVLIINDAFRYQFFFVHIKKTAVNVADTLYLHQYMTFIGVVEQVEQSRVGCQYSV